MIGVELKKAKPTMLSLALLFGSLIGLLNMACAITLVDFDFNPFNSDWIN